MLEGGRPSDVVALEARNRANERMISHLNIQVMCEKFQYILNNNYRYMHQLHVHVHLFGLRDVHVNSEFMTISKFHVSSSIIVVWSMWHHYYFFLNLNAFTLRKICQNIVCFSSLLIFVEFRRIHSFREIKQWSDSL